MKKNLVVLLLSIALIPSIGHSVIRFGSRDSAIILQGNATLDLDEPLVIDNGTIKQKDNSKILDNNITFSEGIYETSDSSLFLNGGYRPDAAGTGTILLSGNISNPQIFRGDSGMIIDYLEVHGGYNRLEGLPLFEQPIQLADSNSTLTIAIKSTLNQDIVLNGGTIILEDDLQLADGVSLTGPGTVALNGRRLAFGTEDLTIDTPLYWKGAADVYLSGKIDLSATWSFEGDCYFNADSTNLRLLSGGAIAIRNDSSLRIRQLKIRGIGAGPNEGKIFFEDDSPISSSQLVMRRAALELTSTYTVNQGQIVVEIGSGQFVTKDNTFYVTEPGRLTIDSVNAYYKTRTFPDNDNIRNGANDKPDYGLAGSPIILQGNADIYHFRTLQSFVSKSSSFNDGNANENIYLGSGVKGNFRVEAAQPNFSGKGWFVHFAREVSELFVIDVGNSVDSSVTNVVFKDFSPHHLFIQTGQSFTFKDDVTIELGNDIPDATKTANVLTWTFQGTNKIDGKGKVVTMDELKFVIEDLDGGPSTLILQDMIIDKFSNDSITLATDQSKVIFKDVKIILSEDVEFPVGSFEIAGSTEFYSGVSVDEVRFIYNTSSTTPSKIQTCSRLHFDRNVTFSYAPGINNNGLLTFEAKSSELSLHGANLFATDVGLELLKGALVIDHKCKIYGDGDTPSTGIVFGDGSDANNDLTIEIMPGGNTDTPSGLVLVNNVNG